MKDQNNAITKTCTKCKVEKELSQFGKYKKSKDGLNWWCWSCTSIQNKTYQDLKDKDVIKRERKIYYTKTKEKRKQAVIKWHNKNPKYKKEYKLKNKQNILNYNNNWNKLKNKNDVIFNIKKKLRDHFYRGIKNYSLTKTQSSLKYLGCSIEELLIYFEQKFNLKITIDMLGRGIGKWSIDHIIPISNFDLTNEKEIEKCFHYTNLQPMLFEENCKKRNKI